MALPAAGRKRSMNSAAGGFDTSAQADSWVIPAPELARLAEQGNAQAFDLPRPMLHSGDLDFSFSGLKTAVLTRMKALQSQPGGVSDQQRADLAAATQAAIVDVLAAKALKAVKLSRMKRLVVAGGVGANSMLRERLTAAMAKLGGEVFFPPLALCTDNGAMIAYAAACRVNAGLVDLAEAGHAFTVRPRWDLQDVCIGVPAAV